MLVTILGAVCVCLLAKVIVDSMEYGTLYRDSLEKDNRIEYQDRELRELRLRRPPDKEVIDTIYHLREQLQKGVIYYVVFVDFYPMIHSGRVEEVGRLSVQPERRFGTLSDDKIFGYMDMSTQFVMDNGDKPDMGLLACSMPEASKILHTVEEFLGGMTWSEREIFLR